MLRRSRRALAQFGHELVELGLVLGEAQAVEEGAELLLLFLQPAQRLGAVFVERAVAAGGSRRRRALAANTAPALPAGPGCRAALPLSALVLSALIAAAVAVVPPASHASAP